VGVTEQLLNEAEKAKDLNTPFARTLWEGGANTRKTNPFSLAFQELTSFTPPSHLFLTLYYFFPYNLL